MTALWVSVGPMSLILTDRGTLSNGVGICKSSTEPFLSLKIRPGYDIFRGVRGSRGSMMLILLDIGAILVQLTHNAMCGVYLLGDG